MLFWYTTFFEHTQTGIPILKPLWLLFPEPQFLSRSNEFVVGNHFIIIPYVDETKEE